MSMHHMIYPCKCSFVTAMQYTNGWKQYHFYCLWLHCLIKKKVLPCNPQKNKVQWAHKGAIIMAEQIDNLIKAEKNKVYTKKLATFYCKLTKQIKMQILIPWQDSSRDYTMTNTNTLQL